MNGCAIEAEGVENYFNCDEVEDGDKADNCPDE